MLGAIIHRALRWWLFQVPTKNIGTMSLFAITDLPLIIAFSPRVWLNNISQLRILQNNLKTKKWASISDLYPRNVMWAYAYLLFFWGRYCNALPAILALPEKCLPAEIFLRYICQIDAYVDSFDSRSVWTTNPYGLTRGSEVRKISTELCSRLNQLDLSDSAKRSIIGLILEYRRGALERMQHWAYSTSETLLIVIKDKEQTAGNLWYTWSRLLSYLYEIPQSISESISEIFFNLGMAIQVVDDLGDTPTDYKLNAQNLFLTLVHETPNDWERLQKFLQRPPELFLNWPWVRKNIPDSYHKVLKLYKSYADKILDDRHSPELMRELHGAMERVRALAG